MENKPIKLKRDFYLSERGGTAKLIGIMCQRCTNVVLLYQKDGQGALRRCYLNRIFGPEEYAGLQHAGLTVRTMPNLVCRVCKNVIGVPMVYSDGRLAFRLKPGAFVKKLEKGVRYR